ncbi:MBL fold metallo-hydrolase [Breznakia sp. OttesenSCG-928-G09]|nr:MBL fold metallo-hydrolase [Breznakia sp. OttesenSCG-928-G09]
MKIETYPLGMLQANCYLIWKDNHVLIVDPGGSSKRIVEYITQQEAIVDAILLTHGHYDHIGGVEFFVKQFHCPVYISEADQLMIDNPKFNCSDTFEGFSSDIEIQHYTGNMKIENFTFEVMDAPGHTNGSVLLVFDDFICSGDVLFKQSIGRCDLPTGSNNKMFQTLSMIKGLNSKYKVYPGHGDSTTLYEEFLYNPFLKDIK